MSATVAAALKKIAVAILTDKKALKTVGGIILGILIIICLPVVSIISILNGDIQFDEARLQQIVVQNLSAEEQIRLQAVEDTMYAIDTAMRDRGFDAQRVKEAQVLYVLALSDCSGRSGFVQKLVGCFAEGQSDSQLIAAVNVAFGKEIDADEFSKIMNTIRAVYISTSGYVDPYTKNNLDLVTWAKNAKEKGWGYVWGTYGSVLTRGLYNAKEEQYPDEVGGYADFIKSHWLGGRTADCVGLIKGYGWLDPDDHEVHYGTNGMPDIGADAMYYNASEKGSISTIPEIPGLAVWKSGHIGIYIGNGQVIHASGTMIGVIQSPLGETGWTHWLKIPYITYLDSNVPTAVNEQRIWDTLYAEIGNPYGTAALMGNLFAESSLRSNNLQDSYEAGLGYTDVTYTQAVDDGRYANFTSDQAGYGLAQWTVQNRKSELLAFANERGCSISDLDMQLAFLCKELETKFPDVLAKLKTASSIREASDYVLVHFEAPYDQSESVKVKRTGYALDFVQRYFHKSFPEAVEYLLGSGCGTLTASPVVQREPTTFTLPKRNDNMRRVYTYLISRRGIDRDVVNAFAYRQMIYESAEYHNAVFVGFDSNGIPHHANLRGTGAESTFKGNAPGSIPEYSFHWTGTDDRLYLFEAPIDLLSFISLHKDNWRSHSYAACCGVGDRVLFQMLRDNPNIQIVCLCLDNDEAGQAANNRIAGKLHIQGIQTEILVPTHKDWNEDLLFPEESEEENQCPVLQL